MSSQVSTPAGRAVVRFLSVAVYIIVVVVPPSPIGVKVAVILCPTMLFDVHDTQMD